MTIHFANVTKCDWSLDQLLNDLNAAQRTRVCGLDRIQLTQDKAQWRTLMNTVMSLRVP
jgi:hypothetical protein